MGILCVNLNPFDKARVKSWLKSGKLDQFYAFCQKNGYDPEEIKGVLAKSSTPTTVSSPDPAVENADQIIQDQNTDIAEYLNNVQRTKAIKQFSKDIVKYCIIDFDGNTPIMRMPSEINSRIAEYKLELLNKLRDFLQYNGFSIPSIEGSNAKKSQIAAQILNSFWSSKDSLKNAAYYSDILQTYAVLHTFDKTLSTIVPFIKVAKKHNPDMFVVGRYSWDGFGTETFISWSTSEYADAETNSSEFFKLFLKNIPLVDKDGRLMDKRLSFSSLLALFAEFKTWHKEKWASNKNTTAIKMPSDSEGFETLLKEYENDTSVLKPMRPVLKAVQQILFAKHDVKHPVTGEVSQEYIIGDTIRNLVINACLKYEPAKYLDNEFDAKHGTRSADLIQRVAVAARVLLIRNIRGQLATIVADKEWKQLIIDELKEAELWNKKSFKTITSSKEIHEVFNILFSLDFDNNIVFEKTDVAEINKFLDRCAELLNSKETDEKRIISATDYDKFQKPFHAAFTSLANALVSSSDKYVKSTIKNAENNNVPASQLPSYITKWADRASDPVSGSFFIQRNAHLIKQPFMQSISKIGDETFTLSTMTESEILHLWISAHFCQRFTDAVKYSKEVGDSIFIQPTCFADKSTSFSFPIPINRNFNIGMNKSISVRKILEHVKQGNLNELYSTIKSIYFEDSLGLKIINDFQSVYPKWKWDECSSEVEALQLISKKLKKLPKEKLISDFVKAGIDCIEDVHYTKSGINTGALMELMIYDSLKNTTTLIETVYNQFKDSILQGGDESLWNALRKEPAVVAFYSQFIENTKYANDSAYKLERKVVPLTLTRQEWNEFEEKLETIKAEERSVVPNTGIDLILQPYFFSHVIFGKPLNDYFFGSALAHPNKSGITTVNLNTLIQDYIAISANQWITQTKRESVGGATYHSYFPNIVGGMPAKVKCAIIEDETTQVNNITGDTNDRFEPNDGSGLCHPIISRAMNISLLDNPVGETKKTTYGAITSTGTQNNEKWAEAEITNAKMRHAESRTSLRKIFKKMSKVDITSVPKVKMVPKNLYIDPYNQLEYKQVNSITIENGSVLIRFVDNSVIDSVENTEFSVQTLDDVFRICGDCWAKSMEEGDLVYSEASLDILYEYAVKAGVLDQVIAYVINKTACKVGAINVNSRSRWTNDEDFDTFELDTTGGGPMMDADHELQDSEGTESTQMLLALAQNGTSLDETSTVFRDIATIISEETKELERGLVDQETGIKIADKYVSRTLKRSREGYSTAKQKIDEYHAKKSSGEVAQFPIEVSAVNTAVVSAIRSHVSSKIIKRKYGGIGAVNTPGHNTVMYHVVNGQPMLYEELRELPLYRECLASGIDPFRTISINNPFIQKVTSDKPIDFEDTIVIRNKPLTYAVHTIENEFGEQSLFYATPEGAIAISSEDPGYDPDLGVYIISGQYIDANGNITTNEWSEPIIIDTIEKYFTYRHRDDLDVYNWTIMAHNLKGIDSLYMFDVDGVVRTFSINETLYNKAMYIIKNWDGKSELNRAIIEFGEKYNIPNDDLDAIYYIVTRYEGHPKLPADPTAKKKKILQLLCKDLRKDLKSPNLSLFTTMYENAELLNVETIPAQIIMGRTYAKQFGLKKQDTIAKIRQEGFWESRYQDRFYCPDNHEIFTENLGDIVLFDGTGNRLFIKYDPLNEFVPNKVRKSRNIVENSEGTLYYNGEEFIEKGDIKVYSYKTSTGSEEDVIVINNLEDLQRIKDFGFNITQYHFTEDNYKYLLPVRYDFESITEHYLWKEGKRTTITINKDSINNPLTKALIPALNDSEKSSLQHLMKRKLKNIAENFEKSLEFVGTRIPCQSMQSFMACKVICFTDVEKNEIYVPAKLAWIQGSDYDIDKLYLTGRIFNSGGSMYSVFNKNKTARAIGLKNRIVDGLWEIVTNPVNQVSGTIAVNIDSLKAVGAKSKLASRQKTFSQLNPNSVASMIAENSSGKQVIGIAAVANKGNSVIAYYYNNKMREINRLWQSGNFSKIKSILEELCKIDVMSDGTYNIFSMYSNLDVDFVDTWQLSENPTFEEAYVFSAMKQIQENNKWYDDVDQALGEILNAAADNAKELILKKINATGEWTDVWAYALTQGYTVEQIYDVMTNDELQSKLTTRNIFAGFKAVPRWEIPFGKLQDPRNKILKHWCDGAEEFGLLNGITKINQGIKTTEYEYLTFYHQFEIGVNNILGNKPGELKFDMQRFVFDEVYRSEMISLYEGSKRTYNLLAMFANHPMFMEMWRTYFISSMFLQKISPRENLNMGVISANRRSVGGAISKDSFIKLSNLIDETLLDEFCRNYGFTNALHARNTVHKALIKYVKQLKKDDPDNAFAKSAEYSVITPVVSDNEVSVLVPGIDLYEVDKNWDLQETYARILEAIKGDNSEIRLSFTMSESFKERRRSNPELYKLTEVSLPEVLWLYSILNYKTNSAISFMRFAEEVGFDLDLAQDFSNFVKSKAEDSEWINKLANRGYYVAGKVKAISKYIQSRLEQIDGFIRESQLSTRVFKNKFLESVQKSGIIELFDDSDLQKFKDLGFTETELNGVLGAKAFIYDGILYLNKDASYKDLLHEISHIMVINMSLTSEGRTQLHSMFESILQTSLGQQILQSVRQNPIYAGLSETELEDEVVARYHELNPEWLGDYNHIMDRIEDMCQQWITSETLSTTKLMQRVKTFRNQQMKDGNIERQCE